MSHLSDKNSNYQGNKVIMIRFNLQTIGVTHAEPFPRDLCHLASSFTNGAFVVESVALYFRI
jgi:hypothetical protein